jgi:hypothetical protein
MSGIVVDDQMQVEIGRGLLIDWPKKAQELPVAMALQVPITLPSSILSAANRVVVSFVSHRTLASRPALEAQLGKLGEFPSFQTCGR